MHAYTSGVHTIMHPRVDSIMYSHNEFCFMKTESTFMSATLSQITLYSHTSHPSPILQLNQMFSSPRALLT